MTPLDRLLADAERHRERLYESDPRDDDEPDEEEE